MKSVVKEPSILEDSHHEDVIGKVLFQGIYNRQSKKLFFTDLIGSPTIGILTLLDDEGKLLQTSANFAEVVHEKWPMSTVLIRNNLAPISSFTVRHYASDVTYQTVNKNVLGWLKSLCLPRLL